jgi:hypothetical protein
MSVETEGHLNQFRLELISTIYSVSASLLVMSRYVMVCHNANRKYQVSTSDSGMCGRVPSLNCACPAPSLSRPETLDLDQLVLYVCVCVCERSIQAHTLYTQSCMLISIVHINISCSLYMYVWLRVVVTLAYIKARYRCDMA